MKLLKKLSILLALCMACVLVLAACGPKNGGGKQEEPTEAKTEEVTTEEATTKEVVADDASDLKGTISGTTYTCPYMGLKFEAPSTWVFYSDAELASQSGVSESDFVNNFAELAKNNQLYTLFAQRSDGSNISIILQDGRGMTKESLNEALSYAGDSVEEALKEAGADNIVSRVSNVSMPLDNYVSLEVSSKFSGFDVYQEQVYALVGDYAYVITVTCIGSDGCDEIFSYFQALN